ncbi:MAG TPA: alpha/beta hydrolase-fold protein [Bryobacterales bacterium]|nr:alpha/beta hydrolase-fold protein [Bryobacterales bacterium]
MATDKVPPAQLLEMAHKGAHSAQFRETLVATLGEAEIHKGTAVLGEGPDFLWAVEAEKTPALFVDDEPAGPMKRLNGSNIWYREGKLATGTSHLFYYVIDGARFGGKSDVPAYTPDSYTKPGVPQGKLSEKLVNNSKTYPGMQSNYWIYVPAEYDPATPAALMVWQDGEKYTIRDGSTRLLNVIDNLTYEKKIPVIIQVLISPGLADGRRMRSIEYDTVSDRYARFLQDDILAEVQAKYSLRKDGYSRGIAGESSGGICSFNVAWFEPDQFSRVLSRIGSFTSIQWHPGEIDGGNVYPFKIRKEPKRNIRVWLQDGSNDLENNFGSWPLQNIQMANSLKRMDYDFHFTFGNGTHNTSQGNAQLPEALAWLWRDYDPHKTAQVYEMEASEKAKPLFRVKIYNRD